jgi:hypothetical protein
MHAAVLFPFSRIPIRYCIVASMQLGNIHHTVWHKEGVMTWEKEKRVIQKYQFILILYHTWVSQNELFKSVQDPVTIIHVTTCSWPETWTHYESSEASSYLWTATFSSCRAGRSHRKIASSFSCADILVERTHICVDVEETLRGNGTHPPRFLCDFILWSRSNCVHKLLNR